MENRQSNDRGKGSRRLAAYRIAVCTALTLLVIAACSPAALAYIGPGAGFVFVGSFLILFVTFILVLFSLLTWPARCAARALRRRKVSRRRDMRRVVIVGLDGLKPEFAERLMGEGKMPHMAKLRETGTFSRLATTHPSISPVAWSSFQTGTNPGRHNIFDFLARNPATYLPTLSSVDMGEVERTLSLGPYSIPLGKPSIRPLRKSKPFWHTLGDHGVSSCVLRVPVTFPPEKYRGVMVSGMCVPDLLGTQGSFVAYTTRDDIRAEHGSGAVVKVQLQGDTVHTHISGPENFLKKDHGSMRIPLKIVLDRDTESARVSLDGQEFTLQKGQYTDWMKINFRAGLGMKVGGMCKFLLVEVKPHLVLYMTPINIDPRNPALPVSHPFMYSSYLSNLHGDFSTLGLAEDTWALSEGVIDEDAFLEQCYTFHEERENMFFNSLDRTGEDVCVCVFDGTDRVQHMLWRYLDPAHPANRGKESERHAKAIDEFYTRMDDMIGRVAGRLSERDMLIVMSDHGFQPFSRGVNVNSWLCQNGYLALKEGAQASGEWFSEVDWTRTKAYAMGLAGIYVNQKGREAQGIVATGDETEALKQELVARLSGLKDDEPDKIGITKVWDTRKLFTGPYVNNAPDLVAGYAAGYRASWDSVTGKVDSRVFEDNVMRWSGDHCIDPRFVPGVLFSNRKIGASNGKRHIMDIAPTVLAALNIERPGYMEGASLEVQ